MALQKTSLETYSAIENFEYEWRIRNLSRYLDGLRGAEFSPLKSTPLRLTVELKPLKKNTDGSFEFLFQLVCLSDVVPVGSKVEFSINIQNSFNGCVTAGTTAGYPLYLSNSKPVFLFSAVVMNGYLSANNLYITLDEPESATFVFRFKFYGHQNVTKLSNTPNDLRTSKIRKANLCSDLKGLYDSKVKSDINFIFGEEEILQAHQSLLVARSQVFARMLENDFSESQSKEIHINDFDYHVFDCFLRYLYGWDIVDVRFETVLDLFALADKYAVDSLGKDCADILASTAILTQDTVCKIIVLAYLHSNETLKNKAIRFIYQNYSLIKLRPEWIEITKNYPELAVETLSFMCDNFK